jgi:hypothetical protein
MKPAITTELILTSASTRADGSLGLRFASPELTAADKTAFFELLNQNLKVLIQPMTGQPEALHEVKNEFQTKTASQRLRAVLYVWWEQSGKPGEFEDWYRQKMEQVIEWIKAKLQPE